MVYLNWFIIILAFIKKLTLILLLGKSGFMALNQNGDRRMNYGIFDLKNVSTSPNFAMVLKYNSYSDEMIIDSRFQGRIEWAYQNYTTPLDEPFCGFDNSKCQRSDQTGIQPNWTSRLMLTISFKYLTGICRH